MSYDFPKREADRKSSYELGRIAQFRAENFVVPVVATLTPDVSTVAILSRNSAAEFRLLTRPACSDDCYVSPLTPPV